MGRALRLLPGCWGHHPPGLAMPCIPSKEKGSVWEEAGIDFVLSPSKRACCSARLRSLSPCFCSLSNCSAEWHDVGAQLASAPRDGTGLPGMPPMSGLLGTPPGPFPPIPAG